MELARYLNRENVVLSLNGTTHDAVIHELVNVLCAGSGDNNKEDILRSIYEVEDIKSTAVGYGVAIPHGRTNSVPHIRIVLGRCARGVDWGGPDGVPVRLVWLVVNPHREHNLYLELLSQITKISIRKYSREALLSASNPEEVIRIIEDSKCRSKPR